MSAALESVGFHFKHGWFNAREQFSDWASGITGFLLFPFFIWLMGKVWGKFNAYQGHYTLQEVMLYVGVTEVLFMTFLRPDSLTRASGDFSITLARPRSWLAMAFSGLFGRCLGSRIVYLLIFILVMIPLDVEFQTILSVVGRLLILFPLMGVIQALIGLLFSSAQVLWAETSYFILPVSKIFLALGGVFGPLTDFGEPWRSALLALPPADVFFQVGHFCVKGEFYEMSASTWLIRVGLFCLFLWILNAFFHRLARKYHQSYGG